MLWVGLPAQRLDLGDTAEQEYIIKNGTRRRDHSPPAPTTDLWVHRQIVSYTAAPFIHAAVMFRLR